MKTKIKRLTTDLILLLVLIVADMATKKWAVLTLKDKSSIPIIKNVLEFYYLPNGNTGAAFGMLSGHRVLFLVIAAVVVAVIGYALFNMPEAGKFKYIEFLLVFIAAGGVGNMIDRFIQGYVVDFIYISCINFPIFNVADMYVSICTVLLAVKLLFGISEEDYRVLENALSSPLKRLFGMNNK